MGNCWARFEEWLCPNPWSGIVIDKLDYKYTVRRVSLDNLYNSIMATPATPALNVQAVPLARVSILGQLPATDVPQQQQQQQQHISVRHSPPPPKTQPLPSPTLSPIPPPLKPMEEMAIAPVLQYEQKTPLLTAAQPKHYNSVSSSPLILSGKPIALAPPPSFSLLNITMNKPIHIEH